MQRAITCLLRAQHLTQLSVPDHAGALVDKVPGLVALMSSGWLPTMNTQDMSGGDKGLRRPKQLHPPRAQLFPPRPERWREPTLPVWVKRNSYTPWND